MKDYKYLVQENNNAPLKTNRDVPFKVYLISVGISLLGWLYALFLLDKLG